MNLQPLDSSTSLTEIKAPELTTLITTNTHPKLKSVQAICDVALPVLGRTTDAEEISTMVGSVRHFTDSRIAGLEARIQSTREKTGFSAVVGFFERLWLRYKESGEKAKLEHLVQSANERVHALNPDINFISPVDHMTSLMRAAQAGDEKEVRRLVTQGANPDIQPAATGNSALHLAAANGHTNIVRYLIGLKVAPEARVNNEGNTPLHEAASHNQVEVLRLFKELQQGTFYKTALEVKNKKGNTPLFHAIKTKNLESANYLTEFGAKVNTTDASGQTILGYCKQHGHEFLIHQEINRKPVERWLLLTEKLHAKAKQEASPFIQNHRLSVDDEADNGEPLTHDAYNDEEYEAEEYRQLAALLDATKGVELDPEEFSSSDTMIVQTKPEATESPQDAVKTEKEMSDQLDKMSKQMDELIAEFLKTIPKKK